MPTQYFDPKFVSLLELCRSENQFSMNYDRVPKVTEFIAKLTGDPSNYYTVISLMNTMGLSIANKDSVRDPKTVWPYRSRVADALNILANALAYQASLNPEFEEFASVEAVNAQFALMDQCLSEHWLAVYDLMVGLHN